MAETRLLTTDAHYPDWETLAEAAEVILRDGVVVFRTDTIYGLGASVSSRTAVERVRQAKGSGPGSPLLIIVPERAWAAKFVRPGVLAREMMEALWPGPLTLILPASPRVPQWITAGGDTVAMRLPLPGLALSLARTAGIPLTATSANRHGDDPVASGAEAMRRFGGELELVIESGKVVGASPSTIVDVSGPRPRMVRTGPVGEGTLVRWLSPAYGGEAPA